MTIIVVKLRRNELVDGNCKETAHQMFVTNGRDDERSGQLSGKYLITLRC